LSKAVFSGDSAEFDSGEFSHVFLPGGNVLWIELIQMAVSANLGHDFHQSRGGLNFGQRIEKYGFAPKALKAVKTRNQL
jgi:hypothetical protein